MRSGLFEMSDDGADAVSRAGKAKLRSSACCAGAEEGKRTQSE